MILLSDIQKKLAEAIKTSGMTQIALARKLGIKQQQISCYVHGKKMPALDTLANMCAILDLDANEILCIDKFDGGKTIINSFNNNSGNINSFNNNNGTINFKK